MTSISFALRSVQGPTSDGVEKRFGLDARQLDSVFLTDIGNNFPLEVVQQSCEGGRTFALA